ncbi:MAG: RagB/SusD family nutrient uptake outer membrane protein [Cyclobacteriaceae bacterium]|nr:RagB/SusD family nutrient uptake outer membrane protein [Cyclobacteriaceae bacterium]
MKNKLKYFAYVTLMMTALSCADELDKVTPKIAPGFSALSGELGISYFAKGAVYINGFGGTYTTIDDGLGTGFHILVYGMHESMGDAIFAPWGNNNFKFLDNPTDFKFDDGHVSTMPIGTTQPFETKLRNNRSFGATNNMLVEWTYMYALNNGMNIILENVDKTVFGGDAATKKAALKAWAHYWKGYAYSRIGSMYVSGLVIDKSFTTAGDFVPSAAIIAEAKNQFDQAIASIGGITSAADYAALFANIMPDYVLEKGLPTTAAWIHNCNTMKARNILANHKISALTPGPLPAMTPADWTEVRTLTAPGSGIAASDGVYVIKTTDNPANSIIDPFFGAVGPYATTNDPTYFISEKLLQDYRAGDRRVAQNFDLLPSPQINIRGRGYNFGSRWFLTDAGTGAFPATYTYSHIEESGVDSHYMTASWEENQLMQAEAIVQSGGVVATATALVDAVRTAQGAGLAAIVPTTAAAALEEIRSERRAALLFRGVAFYDARRQGIITDKSSGGGRGPGGALNVPGWDHETNQVTPGAVVLHETTFVNRNAFINYNYLHYWDVPQNELEYNAPKAGSSVVVSPN